MIHVFMTKGKNKIDIGPEGGIFPSGYLNRDISQQSMIDDMLEDLYTIVEETKEKLRLLCVYAPSDITDMQYVTEISYESTEYLETNITKYNTLALMRIMMDSGYKVKCEELHKEAKQCQDTETAQKQS